MEEDTRFEIFGRKVADYFLIGAGLCSIVDGITRIANHQPEQLFNNFNNGQYIFSSYELVFGGALLAYGIENIANRCIKKQSN